MVLAARVPGSWFGWLISIVGWQLFGGALVLSSYLITHAAAGNIYDGFSMAIVVAFIATVFSLLFTGSVQVVDSVTSGAFTAAAAIGATLTYGAFGPRNIFGIVMFGIFFLVFTYIAAIFSAYTGEEKSVPMQAGWFSSGVQLALIAMFLIELDAIH